MSQTAPKNYRFSTTAAIVMAAHEAGIEHETLTIPFLYEAAIIPPRCRKPRIITLTDTVQVKVRKLTREQFPVAMMTKGINFHWDTKKLYQRLRDRHYDTCKPGAPVPLENFIDIATNPDVGDRYETTSGTPFSNYWRQMTDTGVDGTHFNHAMRQCGMLNTLSEATYSSRDDVKCREWLADNRDIVARAAQTIADEYIICEDEIYVVSNEPRYQINTFGMGGNHGGTGMFVKLSYNSNIGKDCYFNALQYEDACKHADSIAIARGDNKSVPVRPSDTIAVYIEEAVICNPLEEHGDGDPFINSIEAATRAGGPLLGLVSAMSQISSAR